MPDLTCVGLTTLDVLARPVDALPALHTTTLVDEIGIAPAGTAGGTAVIAATLGLSTELVTNIGNDSIGRVVKSLLTDVGVSTEHVHTVDGMPTSTTILTIRSDGERPNYHMVGASGKTQLDDAAIAVAKESKVFHFAGVGFPALTGEATAKHLQQIQAAGTFVTCDLIGPTKSTYSKLKVLLPYIDLFLPSEAEVAFMLGNVSTEEALKTFISHGVKHCIIKRGDKGCVGLVNGEIVAVAARDITPVDTTSCGDSFCAGVIYGLIKGQTFKESMIFGTATASLVAQGLGTLGKLSGAEQVEQLVL